MKRTIIAIIILLLFSGIASAGVLEDLQDEGVIKLAHFYQSGSLYDFSENGNDGVATDIQWSRNGVSFNAGTSKITVADSAELRLTEGALIVYSADGFLSQTSWESFISKRDAGGTNYDLRMNATHINLYDGTVQCILAYDVTGHNYISTNFANGEAGEVFVDGASVGNLAPASTVTVNDAPIRIGNYIGLLHSTLSAAIIISRKLTPSEHAGLYAELAAMVWPTRPWGRAQGTYGAELVNDGKMEDAGTGAWPANPVGTTTKESGNVLAGSQVLREAYSGVANPAAHQEILTVGKTYHITGWARGDGVKYPRIQTYSPWITLWSGSSATTWQRIDVVFTAGGTDLKLHCMTTAAGYAEFDNVSVREVLQPEIRFKTDWGVHDVASLTAGDYIPGTPASVTSGTFRVVTEVVDGKLSKVLECTSAGIVAIPENVLHQDPEQKAYGTWDWWMLSHGTAQTLQFISDDSAGTNGYALGIFGNDILLYRVAAGIPSIIMSTNDNPISEDTWYHYRVTRRQRDGQFTVYLDGSIVSATGSGTNPIIDNTYKTSNYIGLDLDGSDKVSWSDLEGDHAILKYDGVIP